MYIILAILVGILFYLRIKAPVIIGKIGEQGVSSELKKLDLIHYTTLNNLLLPASGNTTATQIDHIVVSCFGIFCIETKTYKGCVFGNANQKIWTQVNYHRKDKFYNPFWQNYAHLKSIEALLGTQIKAPIVSLVIFRNADKIEVKGSDLAGNTAYIVNKIKSFVNPVYTDQEISEIINILVGANINGKDARKQHIKEVIDVKKSAANKY